MSSENKICTRSSANTSKGKALPEVRVKKSPEVKVAAKETSSDDDHTCGKVKVSHTVKKAVGLTKRPPKVLKKINCKRKPSSSKLIAKPGRGNLDGGAIPESTACLPNTDSTDASVGKIQDFPKPATRTCRRKKVISKDIVSTDSSSFDSSLPNSPVLKNVSRISPKCATKKRRISSSDSQEIPTDGRSVVGIDAFKKTPLKKKVCFADNYEKEVAFDSHEYNLPCSSVSVSHFTESSPKCSTKRRKLTISCEQQSTSSESEMNSNKEFFIISDSELNNYMNSDQEINIQLSASSEEEGVINSNQNACEDSERGASARESKFICVYKDQQLKSLGDGESLAVVVDREKMLAALNYYFSEKNFSADQSPTKRIGPTLNEIHPDLFFSPPSAEVVSNLQLFTKDKEVDGNASTLELSPKMISYANVDQKAQMSLHDSRLLPDVSLCYDPSMEELVRSSPKEVSPPKASPSPKKRRGLRGKKKCIRSPKKKAASKERISVKEKSSVLRSCREGAKTSDLDCSLKITVEGNTIEASKAPDEVSGNIAITGSELAADDLRSDGVVIDSGSHGTSDVLNKEVVQSQAIERKESDDSDKLIIFTDDENLDFEPDTEYPSYLEKNPSSSENSKTAEAYTQSLEFFSTDCPNDEGINNVHNLENTHESSVKDRKLEEETSARETPISSNQDDLVHSPENCAVEYNEEGCEQTNFISNAAADYNKTPESELETELEEEEAWSASEMPSPDQSSSENDPLENISTHGNSYSSAPLLDSKRNRRSSGSGDSDSETDHSFKRRERQDKQSENKRKVLNGHGNQDRCDALSSTSTSFDKSYDSPVERSNFVPQSPPYHGGRFQDELNFASSNKKPPNDEVRSATDVLQRIVSLCEKCDIRGAIDVSKRFISVSGRETQEQIFQELFWAVMGYITHPACPEPSNESAELASCVLDIFHEFNLRSSHTCSMIVCKSLQHVVSVPHALDVVQACQKLGIPLSEAATVAYINHLMSMETSVETYLGFLEYIKRCGEFELPRTVLHKALTLFLASPESQSLALFKRICDLLCASGATQVEEDVRSFITCCVQNDCWLEIVKCFKAWSRISSSCHILSQVFACPLQSAGIHYGKFAAALHDGVDSLPLNLTHLFGQMGVMLMLEAYSKDELKAALEVLYTLHHYRINYYELQVPLYKMDYIDTLVKAAPESPEPVYSFTVAFAAVDVFMQTAKPKTAFSVLQGFSKTLPANLNEMLRSKITPQLYRYFLKLSQILHQIDPLYKGLEALNAFLSAMETHVNQDLKGVTLSNMNDLRTVYLQNSVSLLNAERVREAFDLFHRCASIFQDDLKPQKFVVRGLLTAASLHRMHEEAQEMYLFGCMKKIYTSAKLDFELSAWNLLIESCWTRSEIKFVLASFLDDVNRFYILKKRKMMGENLYTLRIQFKPDPKEFSPELKCLKVSSTFDAALERVGLELRIMDPNIFWRVDSTAKAILINPDSLYDFWESKFPEPRQDRPPHSFLIKGNHRYSFGADISETSPPRPRSNVPLQSPFGVSSTTTVQPPVSPTVTSKSPHSVSPTVTARHSSSVSPAVTTKHPSSPTVKTKHPLSVSPTVKARHPHNVSPSVKAKHPPNVSPTVKAKHPPNVSPTVKAKHPQNVSPTVKTKHPLSVSSPVKANHPLSASQTVTTKPSLSVSQTVTTKHSLSVSPSVSKKPLSTSVTARPAQSTAATSQPLVCVRPTSTSPVKPRHRKPQVLPPAQSEPVIPNEEFQKVVSFVKTRVFLKCKHLSPQEQERKANNLAKAFVDEHNIASKLDKKAMKLLNEYTEKNINL